MTAENTGIYAIEFKPNASRAESLYKDLFRTLKDGNPYYGQVLLKDRGNISFIGTEEELLDFCKELPEKYNIIPREISGEWSGNIGGFCFEFDVKKKGWKKICDDVRESYEHVFLPKRGNIMLIGTEQEYISLYNALFSKYGLDSKKISVKYPEWFGRREHVAVAESTKERAGSLKRDNTYVTVNKRILKRRGLKFLKGIDLTDIPIRTKEYMLNDEKDLDNIRRGLCKGCVDSNVLHTTVTITSGASRDKFTLKGSPRKIANRIKKRARKMPRTDKKQL